MGRMITVGKAAEILGKSDTHVRQLIEAKELTPTRVIGTSGFVNALDEDALRAYMERRLRQLAVKVG